MCSSAYMYTHGATLFGSIISTACSTTINDSGSNRDLARGIELDAFNRKDTARWGPRAVDVDILLYDDLVLDGGDGGDDDDGGGEIVKAR